MVRSCAEETVAVVLWTTEEEFRRHDATRSEVSPIEERRYW